jgi:hypothetical protein
MPVWYGVGVAMPLPRGAVVVVGAVVVGTAVVVVKPMTPTQK